MKTGRQLSLGMLLVFVASWLPRTAQSHPEDSPLPAHPLLQRQSFPVVAGPPPPPSPKPVKFANAVDYSSAGAYAASIALGDLNGDGTPDAVILNVCQNASQCSNGGDVSVLLGNSAGTFQSAVSYSSGGVAASSVAIGDVNGDGHPDLVVANQCQSGTDCNEGNVSVLLGNGDGTFQLPVSYNAGYVAESVAIGDVNGDGYPDLIVANQSQCASCNNGGVSVLLGNGDGTFQAPTTYSSGGGSAAYVVIADVNGDGNPDLILANECLTASNCNGGGVSVLLGNGDGTFQQPVSYKSGGYSALSVAAADLNDDGNLDLVVANYCNKASNCGYGVAAVLLGNGDGTFQSAVAYDAGAYGATSLAVGDVNGDNKLDLVVDGACRSTTNCRNGAVSVLLGNGDGTFQDAITYSSGGADASSIAIADLNGDGKPDLVTANYCATTSSCSGTVAVLLNKSLDKTTTTLTSSPNPSLINQAVIFTATIASMPPIRDGEVVTFSQGKTVLGTSLTTLGVANFTTTFAEAITYSIKATYSGDAFHKASSGTIKQVVEP